MAEVFRLVEEGEKYITALAGRDVVIVLGNSGVGKSTTINFLLGSKMVRNGKSIDVDPSQAKLANVGHTNTACTVFPALYAVEGHPYVYLDTRGFVGVWKNILKETLRPLY